MYSYCDTVTVSFCFCFLGFIFKDWIYSLVAKPPLSKWEGQGSIPNTKKGRGRREEEERGEKKGKRRGFLFSRYSVKKQLGIFQRK